MAADNRPSWDEYFMKMANDVATRTTCLRRGVGAVIVKDRRILATGYNGVPTGLTHCSETGCLREQLGVPSGQRHEICRGLHAEQNAIIQAARYGINIAGATIYVNTQPCVVCAKMLINAGITEIVYQNPYPDELSQELLAESGILVREYTGEKIREKSVIEVTDALMGFVLVHLHKFSQIRGASRRRDHFTAHPRNWLSWSAFVNKTLS